MKKEDFVIYLPEGHVNLKPSYLECIKDHINDSGANGIGKIFKVEYWKSSTVVYLKGIGTSVSASRFKPSNKEAFEAQENKSSDLKFVDDLQEFPEEGYCQCLKVDQLKLADYLFKIKGYHHSGILSGTIGIAWDKFSYWDVSVGSLKKEYTLEQLNKFINIKTKENVRQNTNNEVQSIASENRQSSRKGTIILRCSRQQIATGIRPSSNAKKVNTGRAIIIGSKIRKNIIQRENY